MPIARFSELGNNLRFDAEFFDEDNQILMQQLTKYELVTLNDCALYIKDMGKFSLYKTEYLVEKGIPFLRATNIKSNFIDFYDSAFISENYHNELLNSQIQTEDILLTTKGVIGISACVSAEIGKCNMSQNLVRLAVDRKLFNPYFVSAFLNTKFGRFQTKRLSSGNMQPYLNFENIRQVLIPKFPFDIQNEIETSIKEFEKLKLEAEYAFKRAEKTLLSELELEIYSNELSNSTVKRFSDSLQTTNRLDAEFYQENFHFIEEKIRNYSNSFDFLENLAEIKDQNFLPEREIKYKYIELTNVDKNGNIAGVEDYLGKELPNRAKRLVKTGDVIISSINGSLDKCAIVSVDLNDSVCSTAFYVIRSSTINSETILTFFKNEKLQNLIKKACSGTILISANRHDFGKILFPLIKKEIQDKIAENVNKSLFLRNKAENILLHANEKIENFIS